MFRLFSNTKDGLLTPNPSDVIHMYLNVPKFQNVAGSREGIVPNPGHITHDYEYLSVDTEYEHSSAGS